MSSAVPQTAGRVPARRCALSRIGQIAVTVRDLDRAVAFYRDVLRLPFLFRAPNLAFFDCAGMRLMLGEPEGSAAEPATPPSSTSTSRTCPRPTTSCAPAGCTFRDAPHLIARMPDHELWMAFFDDSEGNTLALMSEVREA